jgi:arylsulfatase A-like enzyme
MSLSRRSFLELASASTLAAAESTRPPNVILLLGDDHRWDALGCTGNPIVLTPELDRLAHEGVRFGNHFCTTPICCASRASIMLGEYAGSHGIYDFATPLNTLQVQRSYWGQMKQAGYHTGFIGKYGVGEKMPESSFDVWNGFPGQGSYFPKGPKGPHLNHIMRDQANEFIGNAPAGKPFCLSVSFKAPHVQDEDPRQYLPSQDTEARYNGVVIPPPGRAGANDVNRYPLAIQHSENRRRWGVRFATPDLYQASVTGYYRLISGIDDVIGSMRATLEKRGVADNTIIVYSADHGIFNGEHGFAGKWYGHEESLRIPLIVHDPRMSMAMRGKFVDAMTLNIDLQPTLLELAGLATSGHAQGRSVSPFLKGQAPPARRVWFFEHRFPNGGWIPSSEGIRTERWKYIRYTDNAAPFEELYDLQTDPYETANLIADGAFQKQRESLTRYANTWRLALRTWKPEQAWQDPVSAQDLMRDGLSL